jgi:AraC family transcriptional activator of tynA and feaB
MKAMRRQNGDISRPRELAAQDSPRFQEAARLLHHRVLLGIGEPLSKIAYTCGSRDYAHFALEFRRRLVHARRACAEGDAREPGEKVRARTSVSALWTRAV